MHLIPMMAVTRDEFRGFLSRLDGVEDRLYSKEMALFLRQRRNRRRRNNPLLIVLYWAVS